MPNKPKQTETFMEKKDAIIKKFESKLENSPQLEGVLTALKSLLSLSQVGSVFSVLISDYIPSRRTLRLESFVEELSDEFRKIEDKVDTEFITTDEFAFLFEQCFKAASENYEVEKITAFKAIIINSSYDKTVIQLEKEFFLNLTKQLTVLHIRILTFLSDTRSYIMKMNLSENQLQGNYKAVFHILFPNIEYDTIKIVLDDLFNYGLTTINSKQLGAITVSSGIKLMGDRQTTFGKKFLKFITL